VYDGLCLGWQSVTHDQHRSRDPRLAQLNAFQRAMHCQTAGPIIQGRFSYRYRAMAIAIGLDHGHQLRFLPKEPLELSRIMGDGVQIYLGPGQ